MRGMRFNPDIHREITKSNEPQNALRAPQKALFERMDGKFVFIEKRVFGSFIK